MVEILPKDRFVNVLHAPYSHFTKSAWPWLEITRGLVALFLLPDFFYFYLVQSAGPVHVLATAKVSSLKIVKDSNLESRKLSNYLLQSYDNTSKFRHKEFHTSIQKKGKISWNANC